MKLTKEQKANLAHSLLHLKENKINDPAYTVEGWYYGNRNRFIDRHEKTIKMIEEWLKKESGR